MMKAIRLQTEYLTKPLGIGTRTPRFFWNCEGGIKQTAYQITCTRRGEKIWDSGKVDSASMTHIRYEGKPLSSRDSVEWRVRLWDENNVPGEESSAGFELGLLCADDWTAKWISGDYHPKKNRRYPADCFKKTFDSKGKIIRSRLYATARGVYDVFLNGVRIEDFILAPGSTDYRKRIQVQTCDVTERIENGNNTIEIRLGDGWYRGSAAAYGVTCVYGTQTSILAQLEIEYEDGSRSVIGTDKSWLWSNDGPIRFNDLKDGEIYDAAMTPSYKRNAVETALPNGVFLTPSDNVPVTEHEHFKPTLLTAADGVRVLDFGQNLAGYLAFTVKGKKGQKLTLRCGEILDADNHVDMSNIQLEKPAGGFNQISLIMKLTFDMVQGEAALTPRQQIDFFCSGGRDQYKTSFAVFGFRYVQVEGDVEIDPADFTAIAVYSDMEQVGDFNCSNVKINRLVENTRWSMKGNFLDVPTDCPTRERLGWTGDAQIFFDTGAYLMNTAPFFSKWLRDMGDAQYKNGLLPAVFPYSGVEMMYKASGGSVGWADAVYLIPYRFYKRFGDKEILRDSWPMIRSYAEYLTKHLGLKDRKAAKSNPYNAYTYEKGMHLGEWLEPEEFQEKISASNRPNHPEEATAYLYLSMQIIAEIAEFLGEKDDASRYCEIAVGAKKAYNHLFVKSGTLNTERQAKFVRPLALGLLDGEEKRKAQLQLTASVKNYSYRVGTGFLSTPFLLPVLTEAGEIETAYKMLLNEAKPGWLYEITQGATTVWETWEGDVSRNHYSPGAVCQWLFDTVSGIRVAGENRFILSPVPGGDLDYAEAHYQSIYGEVFSAWKKTEHGYLFELVVPVNCTAEVLLPDGRLEKIDSGRYTYEI